MSRRCRRAGPPNWRFLKPACTDAPTPPTRPIEFASAPEASPLASATIDAARRNDLVAALLSRKLPARDHPSAGGAVPTAALALAEFEGDAPERPAALAKAASLAAPLSPIKWEKLSPLARAALLYAPLTPARAAPEGVLVAARIDRSNFTVMTAAPPMKAPGKPSIGPRIVAVAANARPDALMAMLTPNVQAPAAFASRPYGDLRSDAFTGPAVEPLDSSIAAGDSMNLRGPAD